MGHVHAEITLKNAIDTGNARDGHIKEEEVRSLTIEAMVDTGATRMFISEEIRQKLGLKVVGSTPIRIANGTWIACQVTEPAEVIWKNRFTTLNTVIIPGSDITLLGVVPLEEMDLMVNPATQELVGAHGDVWLGLAMSAFGD